MSDMRFEVPKTVEAAVAMLGAAKGQVKIMAGGTDLLIQMKMGRIAPQLVVDVKSIPELTNITLEDGAYRFGAAVTCMELHDHPYFSKAWPGLTEAAMLIGSTQIKGRATVGGNLCNGSPAADSTPALIAAGAVASVVGPLGRREVRVEDIVTGPGKTSLAQGEIVTSFLLPKRLANSGDAYLRFTPRTEMDIAVVGAGINFTLDASGVCVEARVGLGAVAERPLLVPEAAKALIGTRIDEQALASLGAAVSAACRPIDDKRGTKEFRIKVAGVMARRAAVIALERARSMN
ncbi:MAG: xanthine dehydrogenase family protein subunit M [Burkholderiaceae bacterium]